jgi:hypothetical protein
VLLGELDLLDVLVTMRDVISQRKTQKRRKEHKQEAPAN